MCRTSAGHLSWASPESPNPCWYQMRPPRRRVKSTGIHQSGRSLTLARAMDMARSMRPSWLSCWKNAGMKAASVSMLKLPCRASTEGMPAEDSSGPMDDMEPHSRAPLLALGTGESPVPAL